MTTAPLRPGRPAPQRSSSPSSPCGPCSCVLVCPAATAGIEGDLDSRDQEAHGNDRF
eukprot:XP_001709263.1 Hypothetical protein GL50803_26369 [Giardia lamblia ATCC 50803]